MTDHLHNSVSQMIAAAIVAQGGTASALTMSRGALLAALHNLIADDDLSHLTSSEGEILAAIFNVMSHDPDLSPRSSSTGQMLAAIASTSAAASALTSSTGKLWELAMNAVGSFTPVDGGGGGEVPAWVTALAAPSSDLPLLAFDFKNGKYWDGTTELTDATVMLEQNNDFGIFDPASIVAGFGMSSDDINVNAEPAIKAAYTAQFIPGGFTALLVCNLPSPAAESYLRSEIHWVQLPDFVSENRLQGWINDEAGGQQSNVFVSNQSDFDQKSVDAPFPSGVHKWATTILPLSETWAQDGVAKTTATGVTTPSPFFTHICLLVYHASTGSAGYMEVCAIYAPQPDADLPTLSA